MKYSLRSLMTFSIRDLFWVTVVVALAVAWWLDRSSSRKEMQRVQLHLALEEDSNKLLKSVVKAHDDAAKAQADLATYMDEVNRAVEAGRAYRRLDAPEGNLLGPLPNSSAPAPNPPKN